MAKINLTKSNFEIVRLIDSRLRTYNTFLKVYLFICFERERQTEKGTERVDEGQRRREKIPSRICTDMGLDLTYREIMTRCHVMTKNQYQESEAESTE